MTDRMDKRLPVTLLTGFLGAGKAAFLNALLDEAKAGCATVIVNELGDAGQTFARGVFAEGGRATPAHTCHQSLLFPDNFLPLEVSET